MNIRNGAYAVGICFALFAPMGVAGQAASAEKKSDAVSIIQQGFGDFRLGSLADSGANTYVSAKGRIQTIHRWDLNHDGEIDLVFTQDHNHDYAPDAMIYWGGANGPESLMPELPQLRTPYTMLKQAEHALKGITWLPGLGGGRCQIADLNGDGYPDIIFGNFMHNYRQDMPVYIYWGSAQGFKESNRTVLPAYIASGIAVGDLNGDGMPDIVIANRGFESSFEKRFGPMTHYRESYIYWGNPNGFDVSRRTSIPTDCAEDVVIGDFNGDGHPDIAFVNNSSRERDVYVYWGDGTGNFSESRRQVLQVADSGKRTAPRNIEMKTLLAADLNGDGYADLVVAGNHNVIVFNGSAHGLIPERTADLPADNCLGLEAADLNRDGHIDLIVANAGSDEKAPPASTIYWGSDKGYNVDRRTDLPTLGAYTVKAADLNKDGYLDLLFGNANSNKPVPSQIFWGGPNSFAPYRTSELQGFGVIGAGVADLKRDGNQDIVLINHLSGSERLPAAIYWGNKEHRYSGASVSMLDPGGQMMYTIADLDDDGFPDVVMISQGKPVIWWGSPSGYRAENRTELPIASLAAGDQAIGLGVADLNRDGYLDIVCTVTGNSKMNKPPRAFIVYGNEHRFKGARTSEFTLSGSCWTSGALSMSIADLNKDGYLDLIFPMSDIGQSEIWWGGANGYDPKNVTRLDTNGAVSVTVADLDSDGWLDLIFTSGIMGKRKSGQAVVGGSGVEGTTRNSEVFIYWGGPDGFKSRSAVESFGALGATVADFNRDGHLDFAISNYMSDTTRELPAMIYWGDGSRNFSNQRRTLLDAASSSAIVALDLNRDGWPDLVVSNHQKNFSHNSGTNIYWGGPKGFSNSNRTTIPTVGVHMNAMVDPGNIYDRKYEWDYISTAIEAPNGAGFARLRWQAFTELQTGVKFQVRFAPTQAELAKARWSGPKGEGSYYSEPGAELIGVGSKDRWLQYRAVLFSPDGANSPLLSQVEVVCSRR